MLGSPILYFKGIRILMFQLSGFYYRVLGFTLSQLGQARRGSWISVLGFRFFSGSINLNPECY